MNQAVALDIYGTLVNPLEMDEQAAASLCRGARRTALGGYWREKQIEYSFRRGLMGAYEDFGVCTRQALAYVRGPPTLNIELSDEDRRAAYRGTTGYQNLRAFPDAAPALEALRNTGHTLVAFSNGVEETARTLLERRPGYSPTSTA